MRPTRSGQPVWPAMLVPILALQLLASFWVAGAQAQQDQVPDIDAYSDQGFHRS